MKDGKLSQEMAEAILGTAYRLDVHLVVKDDVVACIDALVEAHKSDPPVKFVPVLGTPKACPRRRSSGTSSGGSHSRMVDAREI